ncbi:MAG: AbrB/MazE/SpoVT family DNA-binding domain-containing protein [Ruminococcaceae bacterium]|nr:AbrB/MazE/SpoVT family DNA-binding domain-containing protein [Oscillospiraceae bacterium]
MLKKFRSDSPVSGDLRCLDKFGRIVIPIAVRERLNIESQKDSLEIYCENDNIILRKFEPVCIFCGESEKLTSFKGKKICAGCINELTR